MGKSTALKTGPARAARVSSAPAGRRWEVNGAEDERRGLAFGQWRATGAAVGKSTALKTSGAGAARVSSARPGGTMGKSTALKTSGAGAARVNSARTHLVRVRLV